MRKGYDFVVVGAGSAGCLLANGLASLAPTLRVALLEAGSSDAYQPLVHIPVGYLFCIGNPRTDWLHRTSACKGLNGRSLLYPRGKVLGGCSSINGMIYMRGQAEDYERWARVSQNPDWQWARCLERFKAFEDYHGGSSEWHGSGNQWRVEKQRLHWDVLDMFQEAAAEKNIPKTEDFNRGNNEGVGYFDVNQRKGWRLNTKQAFLTPVPSNVDIITNTCVHSLLFEGDKDNKCRGVRAVDERSGKTVNIEINDGSHSEVILSAGSIGSVQILERSGIGNTDVLQRVDDGRGIKTRVELRGVGENLQDHLQIRTVFKVSNVDTLNTTSASLWGKFKIGLEYMFNRSGPMAMAPSQLGCFTKSSQEHNRPNLQYHIQPLSLEKFGDPLHNFDAFTASVCNLRPTSRGKIHITSSDLKTHPTIDPNYLDTDEDRKIGAEAIRLTRDIVLNTEAFRKCQPEEILPGATLQSDDDLSKAAGDIGTTIFHPVGTCKMGSIDDETSVVDGKLRVIGTEKLRVADASIMPYITSGNTASPSMMIAQTLVEELTKQFQAGSSSSSSS